MKHIKIKDKKDFLVFFNIFKKIKTLKSELQINKDDYDFIQIIINTRKFDIDKKSYLILFLSIISIIFSFKFIMSSNFYFHFISISFFGTLIFSNLIALLTIGNMFFQNLYNKIKSKQFSLQYKYNENKPNLIKFFEEIYYLSFKNKEKKYEDINDIILKFNKNELEILKEYDISLFDDAEIYSNLIYFFYCNLIEEEKLNYFEFQENIDYLLKNTDFEKRLMVGSRAIDNLKLIHNIKNKINNFKEENKNLVYNF